MVKLRALVVGGCAVTSEARMHVQRLRDRLAKVRMLKKDIRDAPDRLRRDAAIVAYTRTVDLLIEDLIALEDAGLLTAWADHLTAAASGRQEPPV